jgi:hypothetical protein
MDEVYKPTSTQKKFGLVLAETLNGAMRTAGFNNNRL